MGYYGELQNGELLKSSVTDTPTIAQQGWQCPVCGRVYSPFTPMCYYCGGEQKKETSTGTDTQIKTRLSYM